MTPAAVSSLPGVDEVLRSPMGAAAVARFGRASATAAVRRCIASRRETILRGQGGVPAIDEIGSASSGCVAGRGCAVRAPGLQSHRRGTAHQSRPRAPAAGGDDAAVRAMASPAALEFDIATGERGERDDHHPRAAVCELTGAEAAIAVNNNAAAVRWRWGALGGQGAIPSSRVAN